METILKISLKAKFHTKNFGLLKFDFRRDICLRFRIAPENNLFTTAAFDLCKV